MKKKIVFIQMLPLLYGGQKVMLNIIDNLDRNNFDITVLSKGNGPLINALKIRNCRHFAIPLFYRNLSPLDCFAFIFLIFFFLTNKFDILHTHSSKPGFLGRIAGCIAGIPRIYHTVHGFSFNQFQPRSIQKLYIFLEKFSSKFGNKSIYVSKSDLETALAKGISTPHDSILIHNGFDINYQYVNKRLTNLRARNRKFVIGILGRLTHQKNIINVIKIAIDVCKKNDMIYFHFLGDGEMKQKCSELINLSDMQDRIILLGWKKNVMDYLCEFDVMLQYTKWEGLPLAILEGMSVGLPIISSNIPGNSELIKENGVLISLKEEESLTKLLVELPSKKECLDQWSRNSLELLKDKFNSAQFAKKHLELYSL